MKIAIFTNTATPHVGGVARSVEAFSSEYRRRGHEVLIVAPEFPDMPERETGVFRIPAIQNFNASDFSVALPVPTGLTDALEDFEPQIVHSQHPFLLGNTAVRIARALRLPLVFTHHTLYEQYTHYVPGDSELLQRFVVELATHYANLSDLVFAPSESIRKLLLERGVSAPVRVVPTGVDVERFAGGDGAGFRRERKIPGSAFVVGHLGRLAPEKNLEFMTAAVLDFMRERDDSYFVLIGKGPSRAGIEGAFADAGLDGRLVTCGTLQSQPLADALAAMNLFAFASKSETQGMVLTEAMAAGLPVVALDASGAREVVEDRRNGRLVDDEDRQAFAAALDWIYTLDSDAMNAQIEAARETAEAYSMPRCADRALDHFDELLERTLGQFDDEERLWESIMARIKAEWEIIRSLTQAGEDALSERNQPVRPDKG